MAQRLNASVFQMDLLRSVKSGGMTPITASERWNKAVQNSQRNGAISVNGAQMEMVSFRQRAFEQAVGYADYAC